MYKPDPLDSVLAAALPPGALFAVGGRVRDEVRAELEGLEAPAKDLDYVVCGVAIDELEQRLAALGRVDRVGAAFAVLKVTINGRTVDIALPRREKSTGIGHRDFAVQSGPDIPLADDLARRDFRMNMIARALPSGVLIDPYGGVADIKACRIDILTPVTFEEDPLRLLRAAHFAARFGYEPTEATRQAMAAAAPLVKTVSAERVYDELAKLFTLAPKPSVGLNLLLETGVLAQLWPELVEGVGVEQNQWHKYDVWRHNLETIDATPPGDLVLRVAALLHDVGKPRCKDGAHFYRHEIVGAEMARDMLLRFRFPHDVVDRVEHLVRHHMYNQDPALTDAAVRRFIRRIGLCNLERQFAVRHADIIGSGMPPWNDSNPRFEARVWAEVERQPAFSIADLHISGADVIETMVQRGFAPNGFRGDERVGEALRWLFEQVTDHPERNERQTLRTLLEDHLTAITGTNG